jgi:hypothetical protein
MWQLTAQKNGISAIGLQCSTTNWLVEARTTFDTRLPAGAPAKLIRRLIGASFRLIGCRLRRNLPGGRYCDCRF